MKFRNALWVLMLLVGGICGTAQAGPWPTPTGLAELNNKSAHYLGNDVADYFQKLLDANLDYKFRPKTVDGRKSGTPAFYLRSVVTYNPRSRLIMVTLLGNEASFNVPTQVLQGVKDLMLSFNNLTYSSFGVHLAAADIRMTFLDADTHKLLADDDPAYAPPANP